VTIHPLADESGLLQRLGLRPSDCVAVDSYWALGEELLFVSVFSSNDPPLVSYRPSESGSAVRHHFYVRTRTKPLTTAVYEHILSQLDAWFVANAKALPSRLVVFSQQDLGEVPAQ
jgi:hypothetical protein